jgi:hypothetical protein
MLVGRMGGGSCDQDETKNRGEQGEDEIFEAPSREIAKSQFRGWC